VMPGPLTVLTYTAANSRWATYLEIQYIPAYSELPYFGGALMGPSWDFFGTTRTPQKFYGRRRIVSLGGTLA